MKVRPIDLDRLIFAIAPLDTPELRSLYQAHQASGKLKAQDLWKRYRWDLLHRARDAGFRFPGEVVYWDELGYNDAHIDTALRNAVPELTEL